MANKSDIVAAAAPLIHTRNFDSVSVRDICEAAAIPKGSFYYWFDSKADLGHAVLDHDWDQTVETIFDPAFDTDLPPLERLDRYVEILKQMQEGWDRAYGCPFGSLGTQSAGSDPALQANADSKLQAMGRQFRTVIQDAIESGDAHVDDLDAAVTAVVAQVEGALLLAEVRNDTEVFSGLGPAIRALIGATRARSSQGARWTHGRDQDTSA